MAADTFKPQTNLSPSEIATAQVAGLRTHHDHPAGVKIYNRDGASITSPNKGAGGYVDPLSFEHATPKAQ
jgi:hypothetical protein